MTLLQPLRRRATSAGRTWACVALFLGLVMLSVQARGASLCVAAAPPPAAAASAEFVGTAVQRSGLGLHVRNCRGDQRVFSLDDKSLQSVPPGAIVRLVHEPQLQEGKSAYRVIEPPRILGGLLHGRFVDLAEDKGSLLLRGEAPRPFPAQEWKLTATGCLEHSAEASAPRLISLRNEGDVKGATVLLHRDDAVCISFQEAELEGKPITPLALHVEWQAKGWDGLSAAFLLAVMAALVAGATWLLLGCKPPWLLFLGQDNRYSTSKFQGVMWFWVLISAYLAMLAAARRKRRSRLLRRLGHTPEPVGPFGAERGDRGGRQGHHFQQGRRCQCAGRRPCRRRQAPCISAEAHRPRARRPEPRGLRRLPVSGDHGDRGNGLRGVGDRIHDAGRVQAPD